MPPPAIPRPALPGGPYVVAGLARSGVAAALALARRGAVVAGTDTATAVEGARALRDAGVALALGDDGVAMLDGAATLVKSPGVPQEAPVVRAAHEHGLTVIGELELAWRLIPNRFIAVTGSNGKTTTTEWLGHVFRCAQVPVAVAGNVGTALTSLAGAVAADAVIVCEASSFQLEDTLAFAPEAAILLNLAEDHLDRHGSLDAYHAAKLQAFARQPPDAVAVAPAELLGLLPGAARRVECAAVDAAAPGAAPPVPSAAVDAAARGVAPPVPSAAGAGTLMFHGEPLCALAELALPGAHNAQNAAAVAAAALAWGLPRAAVVEGLKTFAGVPHRLEAVAEIGGVRYVNDSKATNVDAALTGITSFAGGVHVILGGRGKGGSYRPLRAAVEARCAAAYLIGEAAAPLATDLAGVATPVHRCGDLEHALAAARAAARPGEVVLLSPACASFDQYGSFEERGDHFRTLVNG